MKREEGRIKENQEKIKLNKQLPYLVGHVVEVSDGQRGARGGWFLTTLCVVCV